MPSTLPSVVRFANFYVEVRAGELRKDGSKVRLQEQPFLLLTVLLRDALRDSAEKPRFVEADMGKTLLPSSRPAARR
jgi:DNA-binding winged helix-turn-helix (wHTH) protein